MASTASAGPAAGAADVAVAADDSQDTSGTSSLSSGLLPVLDGTWSRLASEQLKAGIAGDDDDDATLRHLRWHWYRPHGRLPPIARHIARKAHRRRPSAIE
eukprot:scaffold20981_cov122-Isochrysis_galbana.AAC.3